MMRRRHRGDDAEARFLDLVGGRGTIKRADIGRGHTNIPLLRYGPDFIWTDEAGFVSLCEVKSWTRGRLLRVPALQLAVLVQYSLLSPTYLVAVPNRGLARAAAIDEYLPPDSAPITINVREGRGHPLFGEDDWIEILKRHFDRDVRYKPAAIEWDEPFIEIDPNRSGPQAWSDWPEPVTRVLRRHGATPGEGQIALGL